jgi:hypothetical protein
MNDRDLSRALRSLESSPVAPADLPSAGQIYRRAELRQRWERQSERLERGERLARLGSWVGASCLLGALFFALMISISSAAGAAGNGIHSGRAGQTLGWILAAAGPCLLVAGFSRVLRED